MTQPLSSKQLADIHMTAWKLMGDGAETMDMAPQMVIAMVLEITKLRAEPIRGPLDQWTDDELKGLADLITLEAKRRMLAEFDEAGLDPRLAEALSR